MTGTHRPFVLAGSEAEVPLVNGAMRRYVNLDYAASAPPLKAVVEAVSEMAGWYSSVHRGAGFKSLVATKAYEAVRRIVSDFLGARHDDCVVFTRNTTDSINLLARTLSKDIRVICFATEHHANLLPWRTRNVTCLPVPTSAAAAVEMLDAHLAATSGSRALVSVTGASNVTGEVWPLSEIGEVARRHGARLLVDAAQLAPHHAIDMAGTGIDYLAFSGHKVYAPYGAGVLVGRGDWLDEADPYLAGGGAVELVTVDSVMWKDAPDRHEAGSPNVIGVIALGVACQQLAEFGMDSIAAEEAELHAYAWERLSEVPGITLYSTWPAGSERVGLVTFNLATYDHSLLAAILSAEFGIGVRHGCFCAHPLVSHLLNLSDSIDSIRNSIATECRIDVPGAVRMSMGLDSRRQDVDALAEALRTIATVGPSSRYRAAAVTGDYLPYPDMRTWPSLRGVAGLESAAHVG